MHTSVESVTADLARQLATVHFNDGRIQDAVLHSNFLTRNTVQFVPQIPVNDRRKYPRAPYFNDVRIAGLGARLATDISNGGMYVACLTPSPIGTIIPLSMTIENEPICAEARVAFIDPGIGMGLEFHRVPSTARLKLEAMAEKIIKAEGSMLMKTRRSGNDRRAENSPTKHLRIKRYTADRRSAEAASSPGPVEARLSDIKYIFFKGDLAITSPKGPEVLIEFHNGEELRARLFDISHNSQGFFAEYQVSDSVSYTIYFVTSAVKNIQCLV
ncbi:MAG: PilZ domain-containing protein [Nitrospirae bacterium]|nr:PilZ domain-containing protein [Nitrospirota bacterium]